MEPGILDHVIDAEIGAPEQESRFRPGESRDFDVSIVGRAEAAGLDFVREVLFGYCGHKEEDVDEGGIDG